VAYDITGQLGEIGLAAPNFADEPQWDVKAGWGLAQVHHEAATSPVIVGDDSDSFASRIENGETVVDVLTDELFLDRAVSSGDSESAEFGN
jgi:hypothetical protein